MDLRRPLAAVVAAFAFSGALAGPASAHGGAGEPQAEPIIESVVPLVPGVDIQVAFSVNYQFVASNTSTRTITFLGETGEPFLRIGPEGVHGNFASPTFYNANVPEGATQLPPQAKPGADVPPIWRRLAREPSWGWYDHRLHPEGGSVPPEVIRANKVAVLGRWTVPFRIDEQPGEVSGRLEYQPPTGSFTMVQKSTQTPASGVRIQVVPGGTVPAVFIENLSAEPVIVFGRSGEPFARIGPQVSEVNIKSPTWAEVQQASGKDPSDEADAQAEPQWRKVADTPRWQWLEQRAAAPKDEPPAPVIAQGKAVTVRNWSIPYAIGDKRDTIDGITEFVPIAALRERAGGAVGGAEQDEGFDLALYGGVVLGAAVLSAGIWLVTSKVRSRRTV
ncbi:MAG TPA: hypothetical protein VEG38_10110 [Acidimicrobiia bacterium]|nr:hypothetical protein [Acidimicrobiia bacterium]